MATGLDAPEKKVEEESEFVQKVRRMSKFELEVVEETGPKSKLTSIFNAYSSDGENLEAGQDFNACCKALAEDFPIKLKMLTDDAMEGRAFQFCDKNGNGMLDKDEFVLGMQELLAPQTPAGASLAKRLQRVGSFAVDNNFSHVKRVAIIGAGVAGLQMARELREVNIESVIFEKNPNVGGVWRENYADFGLQVPKELYEFGGYPWPESEKWDQFPKGPQVQKYIEMFAKHEDLLKLCRFNTTVVKLEPKPDGKRGWIVHFGTEDQKDATTEEFDYAVVATGMYCWPPHIPTPRGADKFDGTIMHSCMFMDPKIAEGKHVVVVGGGKSAVDCAVAASKSGESSTLLFRRAHWPVPRKLAELVPFKWGTYSRFGHAMLPAHHDIGPIARWLHGCALPIKWVWWRIVELMFRIQFKLKGDMVPDIPIEIDVFNGGQILDKQFRDRVASGKVKALKASISKLEGNLVTLQDGRRIKADIVVYGTGFKKSYSYLDRIIQKKLQTEQDGLWLYRNIIPPNLADIAYVGGEVTTFNNILTHRMQALWLARCLASQFELPPVGGMVKAIEKEQAWKRMWMPHKSTRAVTYQLHMIKYHDMLLKDMGFETRRKGWNLLKEIFEPYQASDYKTIFEKGADTQGDVKIGNMHPQDIIKALVFAIFFYLFFWPF